MQGNIPEPEETAGKAEEKNPGQTDQNDSNQPKEKTPEQEGSGVTLKHEPKPDGGEKQAALRPKGQGAAGRVISKELLAFQEEAGKTPGCSVGRAQAWQASLWRTQKMSRAVKEVSAGLGGPSARRQGPRR